MLKIGKNSLKQIGFVSEVTNWLMISLSNPLTQPKFYIEYKNLMIFI